MDNSSINDDNAPINDDNELIDVKIEESDDVIMVENNNNDNNDNGDDDINTVYVKEDINDEDLAIKDDDIIVEEIDNELVEDRNNGNVEQIGMIEDQNFENNNDGDKITVDISKGNDPCNVNNDETIKSNSNDECFAIKIEPNDTIATEIASKPEKTEATSIDASAAATEMSKTVSSSIAKRSSDRLRKDSNSKVPVHNNVKNLFPARPGRNSNRKMRRKFTQNLIIDFNYSNDNIKLESSIDSIDQDDDHDDVDEEMRRKLICKSPVVGKSQSDSQSIDQLLPHQSTENDLRPKDAGNDEESNETSLDEANQSITTVEMSKSITINESLAMNTGSHENDDQNHLESNRLVEPLEDDNDKLINDKKKVVLAGKIRGKLSGNSRRSKTFEYRKKRGPKNKLTKTMATLSSSSGTSQLASLYSHTSNGNNNQYQSMVNYSNYLTTSTTTIDSGQQEEHVGIENKTILCSSKDNFVLCQDICVNCGSLGKDDDGRLIACAQCGQCYHLYCAQDNQQMIKDVTRTMFEKGWRCLECTVCEGCGKATDDSRLLLCDDCDISYHIYCLDPPLQEVPKGTWKCHWCAVCVNCKSTTPGYRSQWQENYTLCGPCASQKKCSFCQDDYNENDLIIQCIQCQRWLHSKCDSIFDENECEIASSIGYQCLNCRPKDEPPSHIKARKDGTLRTILSKRLAEQRADLASLINNKRNDQQSKDSAVIADQSINDNDNNTNGNPQQQSNTTIKSLSKYHLVDGIYLSDAGVSMYKSQQIEQPKKTRSKRSNKNIKDDQSLLPPQPQDDSQTIDGKDPKDPSNECSLSNNTNTFTIDDESEEEKKRRMRRLRLDKLGIGGFSIKQRGGRSSSGNAVEDDDNCTLEFSRSTTPDNMDAICHNNNGTNNKRKRRRISRKKNQLQDQYPRDLQEAFFGAQLMTDVIENNNGLSIDSLLNDNGDIMINDDDDDDVEQEFQGNDNKPTNGELRLKLSKDAIVDLNSLNLDLIDDKKVGNNATTAAPSSSTTAANNAATNKPNDDLNFLDENFAVDDLMSPVDAFVKMLNDENELPNELSAADTAVINDQTIDGNVDIVGDTTTTASGNSIKSTNDNVNRNPNAAENRVINDDKIDDILGGNSVVDDTGNDNVADANDDAGGCFDFVDSLPQMDSKDVEDLLGMANPSMSADTDGVMVVNQPQPPQQQQSSILPIQATTAVPNSQQHSNIKMSMTPQPTLSPNMIPNQSTLVRTSNLDNVPADISMMCASSESASVSPPMVTDAISNIHQQFSNTFDGGGHSMHPHHHHQAMPAAVPSHMTQVGPTHLPSSESAANFKVLPQPNYHPPPPPPQQQQPLTMPPQLGPPPPSSSSTLHPSGQPVMQQHNDYQMQQPQQPIVGHMSNVPAPPPANLVEPDKEKTTTTSTQGQKNYEKWESEEALGQYATTSAVLYANVNYPNLKQEYPEWNNRLKQIHKIWRQLSTDQRQPWLQKARDNRSLQKKNLAETIHKLNTTVDNQKKPLSEPDNKQQPSTLQPQWKQQQQQQPNDDMIMGNANNNNSLVNQMNEMTNTSSGNYAPQAVNQDYHTKMYQSPSTTSISPGGQMMPQVSNPQQSPIHHTHPMSPIMHSPRLRPYSSSNEMMSAGNGPGYQPHQQSSPMTPQHMIRPPFSPSHQGNIPTALASDQCHYQSSMSPGQRPQSADHLQQSHPSPYMSQQPSTPNPYATPVRTPFSPSGHHQPGTPQHPDPYASMPPSVSQTSNSMAPLTPDSSSSPYATMQQPSTPQSQSPAHIAQPSPMSGASDGSMLYVRSPRPVVTTAGANQSIRSHSFDDNYGGVPRSHPTSAYSSPQYGQQQSQQQNIYPNEPYGNVNSSIACSPDPSMKSPIMRPGVPRQPPPPPSIQHQQSIMRRTLSDPYGTGLVTSNPIRSPLNQPPKMDENDGNKQHLRNLLQVHHQPMRRPDPSSQQPSINNFRQPISPAMSMRPRPMAIPSTTPQPLQQQQQTFGSPLDQQNYRFRPSMDTNQLPPQQSLQSMGTISPGSQQHRFPIHPQQQPQPQAMSSHPMPSHPQSFNLRFSPQQQQPQQPRQWISNNNQMTSPIGQQQQIHLPQQQQPQPNLSASTIPQSSSMMIKPEPNLPQDSSNDSIRPSQSLQSSGTSNLMENIAVEENVVDSIVVDDDELLQLGNDFNILEYADPDASMDGNQGVGLKTSIFDELDEKDMIANNSDNSSKDATKMPPQQQQPPQQQSNQIKIENRDQPPPQQQQQSTFQQQPQPKPVHQQQQQSQYFSTDSLLSDDDFEKLKNDFLSDSNETVVPTQPQPPPPVSMPTHGGGGGQMTSRYNNAPMVQGGMMQQQTTAPMTNQFQLQQRQPFNSNGGCGGGGWVQQPNRMPYMQQQQQQQPQQVMHLRMPHQQSVQQPPPPQSTRMLRPHMGPMYSNSTGPGGGQRIIMQQQPQQPPQHVSNAMIMQSHHHRPPVPTNSMISTTTQDEYNEYKFNEMIQRQKQLETEIGALRKTKKSLNAKRKNRKNQNEPNVAEDEELNRITQQINEVQKQLDQIRKLNKQNPLVEKRKSAAANSALPHSPASSTGGGAGSSSRTQTPPRSVNSPLTMLNTASGPGTPLGVCPSTPQSPSLTSQSPSSMMQNSPLSSLHSPASLSQALPPSPMTTVGTLATDQSSSTMTPAIRPHIVQDDNNPFSDVYLQKEKNKQQQLQQQSLYQQQPPPQQYSMQSGFDDMQQTQPPLQQPQYYQPHSVHHQSSYAMGQRNQFQSPQLPYSQRFPAPVNNFGPPQQPQQQQHSMGGNYQQQQQMHRPPPPPYPGNVQQSIPGSQQHSVYGSSMVGGVVGCQYRSSLPQQPPANPGIRMHMLNSQSPQQPQLQATDASSIDMQPQQHSYAQDTGQHMMMTPANQQQQFAMMDPIIGEAETTMEFTISEQGNGADNESDPITCQQGSSGDSNINQNMPQESQQNIATSAEPPSDIASNVPAVQNEPKSQQQSSADNADTNQSNDVETSTNQSQDSGAQVRQNALLKRLLQNCPSADHLKSLANQKQQPSGSATLQNSEPSQPQNAVADQSSITAEIAIEPVAVKIEDKSLPKNDEPKLVQSVQTSAANTVATSKNTDNLTTATTAPIKTASPAPAPAAPVVVVNRKPTYLDIRRAQLEREPTPPPEEKPKRKRSAKRKESQKSTSENSGGNNDSMSQDTNNNSAISTPSTPLTTTATTTKAKKRQRKGSQTKGCNDNENSNDSFSGNASHNNNNEKMISTIINHLRSLPPVAIVEPAIPINLNVCLPSDLATYNNINGNNSTNMKQTPLKGCYGDAYLPSHIDYYSYRPFGSNKLTHMPPPLSTNYNAKVGYYHEEFDSHSLLDQFKCSKNDDNDPNKLTTNRIKSSKSYSLYCRDMDSPETIIYGSSPELLEYNPFENEYNRMKYINDNSNDDTIDSTNDIDDDYNTDHDDDIDRYGGGGNGSPYITYLPIRPTPIYPDNNKENKFNEEDNLLNNHSKIIETDKKLLPLKESKESNNLNHGDDKDLIKNRNKNNNSNVEITLIINTKENIRIVMETLAKLLKLQSTFSFNYERLPPLNSGTLCPTNKSTIMTEIIEINGDNNGDASHCNYCNCLIDRNQCYRNDDNYDDDNGDGKNIFCNEKCFEKYQNIQKCSNSNSNNNDSNSNVDNDIVLNDVNDVDADVPEPELISIFNDNNKDNDDNDDDQMDIDSMMANMQEKHWKNIRYRYWNENCFKIDSKNIDNSNTDLDNDHNDESKGDNLNNNNNNKDVDKIAKTGQQSIGQQNEFADESVEQLIDRLQICIRNTDYPDKRSCIFCHHIGDGCSNGSSRLLNMDVDKWVHLNCALWSNECYEMLNGALMNVDHAYNRSRNCSCIKCGRFGASLKCFKQRCNNYYHFPCAINERCTFYTDKTIFCPTHSSKSLHYLGTEEMTTFVVNRKVYVNRDEQKQIAAMLHQGDNNYLMRIGSLIFLNIGQLLPHQLKNFHTETCIYPIGYRVLRFYWSPRRLGKRCQYICTINERDDRPWFVVEIIEDGYDNEVFEASTPKLAWKRIIESIVELRENAESIKIFFDFITGEDLFGLKEPAIVRILESLPGIETLVDYKLRYGRSPWYELPLAINPSGSARSEPFKRFHYKRPHTLHVSSSSSSSSSSMLMMINNGQYHRSSSSSLLSTSQSSSSAALSSPITSVDTSLYAKSFAPSKVSLYRKMKQEWRNNVWLGRSQIQGLGLYAKKDIEKHTMIIEYTGLIIRNQIADRNERIYEQHNRGIYMFRLDDNRIIDATLQGGLARYINHSCDPNCFTDCVQIDRENKILIIASRKIQKGEELSYDYKFDVEDDQHKIPCLCGAANCRKWMN